MNRAARRHLLALLESATAPLFVLTPRITVPMEETASVAAALATLGRGPGALVLSVPCDIQTIGPHRSGVRVVAGKGSRRRGIRRDDPLRVVNVWLPEYPKHVEFIPE